MSDKIFSTIVELKKRVSILQNLSEINIEKVYQYPALRREYDDILSEIQKQRTLSVFGVISSEKTENNIPLFKFLSGGALAWLITLCVPFMNTFEDKKAKILAFLLLVLFGGILSGIVNIIPIIFNPWVNYIGYPILQLIILIALIAKPKQ